MGHLERLCSSKGLKVIFITDKLLDFLGNNQEESSEIRVHEIFKDCPLRVAKAILSVWQSHGTDNDKIAIIEEYITSNGDIQIDLPRGSKYSNEIIKDSPPNEMNDEKGYLEADISSLEINSLWGESKKIKKDSSLVPSSDDVLELNIVIEPPLHK
jgi:hypothetical protein